MTTEAASAWLTPGDDEALAARAHTAQSPGGGAAPVLVLLLACAGLVLGAACAALRTMESYPAPLLALLDVALWWLVASAWRQTGRLDRRLALFAAVTALAAYFLHAVPEYVTGLQVNSAIHRSVFSAAILLGVSTVALCAGIYYARGATPSADDAARYPLIVVPVCLVVVAYAFVLFHIAHDGWGPLTRDILVTPYTVQHWRVESWVDGWPMWEEKSLSSVGLRNHIAGTLLLVALTALIATPVGVSVGVFVSEYGPPWLVRIVRGATSLLRATSAFVLGLLALSAVRTANDTVLAPLIAGQYVTVSGVSRAANGSFLLAAGMIAVLVVPVIARTTEEGCRSLPRDLREGSWSLGASEAYTLRRITLPWSLPNIVTGVVLACAEAAGSLAVILFISGAGDFGVGPFKEVTSLTYLVFGAQYGISKAFRAAMIPYQFSAALLLLMITVGLTVVALVLKSHFARRYRGA